MYGDPMEILSAKQTHEARQAERRRKRGTLHVREGWSDARKRAESLFDFARGGAVSADQSPALPASGSLPGDGTGENS
jgi:hypothetical protein